MGFLRVWKRLLGVRKRLFGEAEWAVRIVEMVQMADCQ